MEGGSGGNYFIYVAEKDQDYTIQTGVTGICGRQRNVCTLPTTFAGLK